MKFGIYITLILWCFSCTHHEINEYDINDVQVNSDNASKNNLKNDLQLISIMYSDLFGLTIPNSTLNDLNEAYVSFGDKHLIVERITQNFLLNPLAIVPSDSAMRVNPEKFITDAYRRFLIRSPSEAERWYIKENIEQSNNLTAKDIYYVILTSDEYKHY